MKSSLFFTAVFGLATAVLHAQTSTSSTTDSASSSPPTTTTETAPVTPPVAEPAPAPVAKPAASQPVETPIKAKSTPRKPLDKKGKIEKIDSTAGTFVVEGTSFVLSKKAKVFIDGIHKSLAELKEGDLVAVTYFEKADGTNAATRIYKGHRHKKAPAAQTPAPATSSDATPPKAD